MLQTELDGRRKLYRVNKNHPLTSDITSMIRKVTGIEELVDRVVSRIGDNLEQVWITGDLAKGIESDILNVILVGTEIDNHYIAELMGKVEKQLTKKMDYAIVGSISPKQAAQSLLVWEKDIQNWRTGVL